MKTCAIVDAYSSGNLLAPEFIKRGYSVIHVRSREYSLGIIQHTFHKKDFYLDIAAGDPDRQAAVLKRHGVEFILAGCEVGVELADLLSAKLELPGNGTAKSLARRNKYEMIEAISKADLRTAKQVKALVVEEAIAFACSLPKYDVVLKPQRSAGTNLVFRAHNEKDIRYAFNQILSCETMFEESNTEVCVQEFLIGEEYVIDTVSRNGAHVITDMWKHHFTDANGVPFLYDYSELLDYNDPQVDTMKQYTLDVIDALDIKWGPAHPEIMLTRDGPAVIEVGARLAGVGLPLWAKAAIGKGPVDITADAYCDPKSFELARRDPYLLKTNCIIIVLISRESGKLKSLAKRNVIEDLVSFHYAEFWVEEGKAIEPTVDIGTAPGIIVLLHDDRSVIEEDYAVIRQLERNGLYELYA